MSAPLRLLPLLALLGAGCATTRPAVVISADALIATGRTFEAVGGAFYALCPAHQLPEPACDAWRAFAPRFKAGYAVAVAGWNLVADGADAGAGDWTALVAELGRFAVVAAQATSPHDGGL